MPHCRIQEVLLTLSRGHPGSLSLGDGIGEQPQKQGAQNKDSKPDSKAGQDEVPGPGPPVHCLLEPAGLMPLFCLDGKHEGHDSQTRAATDNASSCQVAEAEPAAADGGWRVGSFQVAHQGVHCLLLVLHHLAVGLEGLRVSFGSCLWLDLAWVEMELTQVSKPSPGVGVGGQPPPKRPQELGKGCG